MVHIHAGRYRDVDAGPENGFRAVSRDVFGDVQWAQVGAVVANSAGVHTDTEWRHHLVEEAVVVVRRKDDDEFGVVVVDEFPRLCDPCFDVVKQVPRRPR